MTEVELLRTTADQLVGASGRSGILHGLVDPTRIVTAGHSAGASAAYRFASADPRVPGVDLLLGRLRRTGRASAIGA